MQGSRIARLLVIGLLAVFAVTPAFAVQYGEVDTEHDYVGLVVFYDASGNPTHRCTGTLLSSTVFLTAGHCTYGTASAQVWFDTEVTLQAGYPFTGGVTGTTYTYDEYDDFASFPNTGDVGIVVLDEPVERDTYGELAPVGTLDKLATKRGRQNVVFDVVGYGLQSVKPVYSGQRVRYQGEVELVNLRSALTDGFNLHYTSNPGQGRGDSGGTCFGDSGGAVFLDDTNVIVAVNSFVLNSNCKGAGFAYRTDTADVYSWIQSFL